MRLDRGLFIFPVMAGVFLSGISLMIAPSTAVHYSNRVEDLLGLFASLSALAVLIPSLMGSKYFFPKFKVETCYKIEIAGLFVLSVLLGINAVVTESTLFQQLTLNTYAGASFTGIIQIAALRMLVVLALHLRRIHKHKLKHVYQKEEK